MHYPLGTFAHKADANAALRQALSSASPIKDRRRGAETTFASYASEWLKTRPLSMRTHEVYESLLSTRLAPLGPRKLSALDGPAIRRWWAAEKDKGQAPKAYRLLRAVLNTAVDDGLIPSNPCRIKGAGVDATPERPILTPGQVLGLADAIDPRLRVMVLLAGFGGLRLGEVRGLRRSRVDLDAGTVEVGADGNVQEDRHGHPHFVAPKSRAGQRTITLPAQLIEEIRRYLDGVDDHGEALLFPGSGPQVPVSKRTIYYAWAKALAKVDGLPPGLHFHDLRHAGATLAAQAGATTKELMTLIGHSTYGAAMNYQHAAEERGRQVADRMAALIDADRPMRRGRPPGSLNARGAHDVPVAASPTRAGSLDDGWLSIP